MLHDAVPVTCTTRSPQCWHVSSVVSFVAAWVLPDVSSMYKDGHEVQLTASAAVGHLWSKTNGAPLLHEIDGDFGLNLYSMMGAALYFRTWV